jgi:fructose-bisphosphate aldolase/2-amino-3,7-dideoxy-D-threo-hept-6-ulosonate synthase
MSRILGGGRTLIVVMDHGITMGPLSGIEDLGGAITSVCRGGADALMLSVGVIHNVSDSIPASTALIATVFEEADVLVASKMGAEAVKTTYFGRVPLPEEQLIRLRRVARESEETGMPYLIEVIPTDEEGNVIYDEDKVRQAARIGAEVGGDLVKVHYTGDQSFFRTVVSSCPVPVVIMGGPKTNPERVLLNVVEGSIKAGGAGLAFGKNVWGYRDSELMTRALRGLLHEGWTAERALKELTGETTEELGGD